MAYIVSINSEHQFALDCLAIQHARMKFPILKCLSQTICYLLIGFGGVKKNVIDGSILI